MSYNLSIWRENQKEDEGSFCSRDFSFDLWTYGSEKLKELGWTPFCYEGEYIQYRDQDSVMRDCLRVDPEVLLNWLKQLEDLQTHFQTLVPLYYFVIEQESNQKMGTSIVLKCESEKFDLCIRGFDIVLSSLHWATFNIDLTERIPLKTLKAYCRTSLTASQVNEIFKGTSYQLKSDSIIHYFKQERKELRELALEAKQMGEMLIHECS